MIVDKANRCEIKDNQTTTLERLSNKEGSRGDTRISLRSGNRIDFVNGLGVGGDGNRKGQMREWRERALGETTGMGGKNIWKS